MTKKWCDELKALHQQSIDFAKVLLEWTNIFGNLTFVAGAMPDLSVALPNYFVKKITAD